MAWPDLLLGGLLLFAALKGWKRGFVSELMGAVALVVAVFAAFRYPGTWDDAAKNVTHLGPGSAHVVAMVAYAAVAYLLVSLVGVALGKVAKLPVVGIANGALGAAVGLCKGAVLLWALLYVALFFPLTKDLRGDLHASRLVAVLTEPNGNIDGALRSSLPWFVRPFANSLFARHRV